MGQFTSGLLDGADVDAEGAHGDGVIGRVVAEAPQGARGISRRVTGLDPLPLRAVSLPSGPILEVSQAVAHELDAGQHFLEALAGLLEGLPGRRIDAQVVQGDLLKPFRHQQLAQGDAHLPRVDLSGIESAACITGMDAADRQYGGALPPLRLRHGNRVRMIRWGPAIDHGLTHGEHLRRPGVRHAGHFSSAAAAP
ncbi:hypothetical protein ACFY5C_27495 [Streptomyces sp. NPDC012935]|uniref:hypothetical protein n=1 Tax=Streptomyces sp. NPDC012935 TaxID=3364857 RepID=UPI0036751B79